MTRGRPDAIAADPPGCLALDLAAASDAGVGCLTCGDLAAKMRVLAVDEAESLALCVDEQEHRQTVDTGIVGAVAPGDTLLVHAGTAITRERI